MFSSTTLLLMLAASVPAGDAAGVGDSLYREGRYEEAAAAYANARPDRPWDDTLILKQFLACESGPLGCAHDAQVDAYYAEKNGSPYAGLMMEYLHDRIRIMKGRRIPALLSDWDWRAFHGDHPLGEREFYALVGEKGVSKLSSRRQGLAWGLGASGITMALAAAVLWASHSGDCGDREGSGGCRAARVGYVSLGAVGAGAAFTGMALERWTLIPADSARALAHRRNLADLRNRMADLDLFGERGDGKPAPASRGNDAR